MRSLTTLIAGIALCSVTMMAQAKTEAANARANATVNVQPAEQVSTPQPSNFIQFVLSAESGTLRALDATENTYSLQLDNVNPQVSFFTNRPRRISEQMDTKKFIKRWIAPPPDSFMNNPPNAALIFHTINDSKQEMRIMQLMSPQFDLHADRLIFVVKAIDGKPMDIRASLINPILTFAETAQCGLLGAWGKLPGEPKQDQACHQQQMQQAKQAKQSPEKS